MSERFPIMNKSIPSIPWAMLSPHEAQARENHGQTLARLAERGGLSPAEALLILDDRPWDGRVFHLPRERAERDRAEAENAEELRRRVEAWEAANAGGADAVATEPIDSHRDARAELDALRGLIRERYAMHTTNYELWRDGTLTPTEPCPDERDATMRELRAAIHELEKLMEGH